MRLSIHIIAIGILIIHEAFASNLRGQEASLDNTSMSETSENVVDIEYYNRLAEDSNNFLDDDCPEGDPSDYVDYEPWVKSNLSYYEVDDDIFDLPSNSAGNNALSQ